MRWTVRLGLVVALVGLTGCTASPPDLCRRYAQALSVRARTCLDTQTLDETQCDSVTAVRDADTFQRDCIDALGHVECGERLPEACNAQLLR
jgi:hypothetical protein